jgi:acyl-coenzyme A synthetase/AMP-(fatty) acid ligase
MAWARERLAPAKRPKEVHVVDELPRTASGKVQKHLLAEQAAAMLGAEGVR